MFCSISGQIAQEPVVSKKSGHLFERRLVLKFIEDNGTCPVTGEPLSVDDIIAVKCSNVKDSNHTSSPGTMKAPRPVSATSIPGMLQLFQNEWDALMMETFTLKQNLDTVREELSRVLHQHDASCRVIAKLIKERDEARKVLEQGTGVSQQGLTSEMLQKIQTTCDQLSSRRTKRKVSPQLFKPEEVTNFSCSKSHPLHSTTNPGITSLDIHPSVPEIMITGGMDGDVILFHSASQNIVKTLGAHTKPIHQVLFHPSMDVIMSCSADNTAVIWSGDHNNNYSIAHTITNHTDEVTGIAIQPCGDFLLASSLDRSYSLSDITTGTCVVHNTSATDSGLTCSSFHPDGLLLGTGTATGQCSLWDIKSQQSAANLKGHSARINNFSFSENGYHLATSSDDGTARIWDLRKLKNIQTLQFDRPVRKARFDFNAAYLAIAVKNDFKLFQSKVWTEVVTFSDHNAEVTDVSFGPDSSFLVSTSMDRHLRVFSSS